MCQNQNMMTQHPVFALLTNSLKKGLNQAPNLSLVYDCPELQTFTISGVDATTFLQGQLTQDMVQHLPDQAKLAGYCNAQGRVLATMVLIPLPTPEPGFLCITTASVAPALIKRLRMFVMRSKVVLSEPFPSTGLFPIQPQDPKQSLVPSQMQGQTQNPLQIQVQTQVQTEAQTHASTALQDNPGIFVVGVSSRDATALSQSLGHDLPLAPWQMQHHLTGTWVCAPISQGHPQRWWWLAGVAQHDAVKALPPFTFGLAEENLSPSTPSSQNLWQQLDVQAGLPWVTNATQDLFIAQTLNLDLIGAVSFTKGCYPGQEVVARAHYRGTLKRRMYLGHIDQAIEIDLASDIFNALNPKEPCGRVISRAVTGNRTDILFDSTISAAQDNALCLYLNNELTEPINIALDELPYSLNT